MVKKYYDIPKIISQFNFSGNFISAEPYGCGHINDTFEVYFNLGGKRIRYILQRINHEVFKWPEQLMSNIHLVTSHLKEKILKNGGDTQRETLNLVMTKEGKSYYKSEDNLYWRGYVFIEHATTYQLVTEPEQLYHVGKAFGRFQRLLQDFPIDVLHESIIGFHDTRMRFDNLERAISEDAWGRASTTSDEITFARRCYQELKPVVDLIKGGSIPLRVTHNDTKLNNIMIDDKTGKGICVIDLDTVMPGTVLSDFGDSIRFGASTALEDETDLSKVKVDLDLFERYASGFLNEASDILTPIEVNHLAIAGKLMTFECGIRFLEDYLNGDNYFKIAREGHNLDRARNQFELVRDMERKYDAMKTIIQKYSTK